MILEKYVHYKQSCEPIHNNRQIPESPPQFENRIMTWVYVRSITRSMLYQKSSILLARTGVWKIISVACGFSSIKIDYSDYPKSFTSRIE